MPQSFCHVWIHLIFSTKNRKPFLSHEFSERLFPYMAGILQRIDCEPALINGGVDHVHCLIRMHATCAVADLVRTLKSNSSAWIHGSRPDGRDFAWQNGYAAFGVSQSNLGDVRAYIANQAEHHRRVSFQDE